MQNQQTLTPYHVEGLRRANATASNYTHVSPYQCIMMILCAGSGASILLLPSILGGIFQTRAYFVVLAGWLVGLICCVLVHCAYQKTSAQSMDQLFAACFGTIFGKILSFFVRIAGLFRAGLTVGIFASAVKGLMLPDTNYVGILLFVCLVLFFVIRCSITASARVCSICMLFLGFVLLLMLTCLPAMHSAYILPFDFPKQNEPMQMLPYILFCASGADILLYLYPAMQRKKLPCVMLGVSLTSLVKLFTLLIACSIFGFYAIRNYTWPLISMFKASNLIGIDRPELILMIFFTVISLTPAYLYASCAIRIRQSNAQRDFVLAIAACVFIFLFSLRLDQISAILSMLHLAGYTFAVIGLLFPFMILIFTPKRKREKA